MEDEEDYELPQDAPYIPEEDNTSALQAKARLQQVEADLAALQAAMNQLLSQMPTQSVQSLPNIQSISNIQSQLQNIPPAPSISASPGVPIIVVPAPPPPPPIGNLSVALSGNNQNTTTHRSNSTSSIPAQPSSAGAPMAPSTSLSDILTGIPALRKVEGERSPGRTVKKTKPKNSEPTTNADIIAQALRKRMQSAVGGSPQASPEKRLPEPTEVVS